MREREREREREKNILFSKRFYSFRSIIRYFNVLLFEKRTKDKRIKNKIRLKMTDEKTWETEKKENISMNKSEDGKNLLTCCMVAGVTECRLPDSDPVRARNIVRHLLRVGRSTWWGGARRRDRRKSRRPLAFRTR